jgi:hypothetical protein
MPLKIIRSFRCHQFSIFDPSNAITVNFIPSLRLAPLARTAPASRPSKKQHTYVQSTFGSCIVRGSHSPVKKIPPLCSLLSSLRRFWLLSISLPWWHRGRARERGAAEPRGGGAPALPPVLQPLVGACTPGWLGKVLARGAHARAKQSKRERRLPAPRRRSPALYRGTARGSWTRQSGGPPWLGSWRSWAGGQHPWPPSLAGLAHRAATAASCQSCLGACRPASLPNRVFPSSLKVSHRSKAQG